MRKDIYYYFESDPASVYNACLTAVRNKFKKEPHNQAPYYLMEFGVTFSFKYNINGGSCVLAFVPYQNGTAVDIGLFIAQLCGARCGAYAKDFTNEVAKHLGITPQEISIDQSLFFEENNYVKANSSTQPKSSTTSQPVANTQNSKFCSNCGSAQAPNSKFCTNCGVNLATSKNTCSACGANVKESDKFCANCGNKIQ